MLNKLRWPCPGEGCEELLATDAVTERPFPPKPAYTEHGVLCPHCGHWMRTNIDTPDLKRKRAALKRKQALWHKIQPNTRIPQARKLQKLKAAQKAKKEYEIAHKAVQDEWREKESELDERKI